MKFQQDILARTFRQGDIWACVNFGSPESLAQENFVSMTFCTGKFQYKDISTPTDFTALGHYRDITAKWCFSICTFGLLAQQYWHFSRHFGSGAKMSTVPRYPFAEMSPCHNVPVLKRSWCQNIPVLICPSAKISLCWNIPEAKSHCAKVSIVTKCPCAGMSKEPKVTPK